MTRAKKQVADLKATKEKWLNEIMLLANRYVEARINAEGGAQACKALKAKIKELIDAKV